MTEGEKVEFLQWLKDDCGYTDIRVLSSITYACIYRYLFTHAILVGEIGDKVSIGDRWCYHDYSAAKSALDNWDGTGEPKGWHRHPFTGRRVDEFGNEEQYL